MRPEIEERLGKALEASERARRFAASLESRLGAEEAALSAAIDAGDLRAAEIRAAALMALEAVKARAPQPGIDDGEMARAESWVWQTVRPATTYRPSAGEPQSDAHGRFVRAAQIARDTDPSDPLARAEALSRLLDAFDLFNDRALAGAGR